MDPFDPGSMKAKSMHLLIRYDTHLLYLANYYIEVTFLLSKLLVGIHFFMNDLFIILNYQMHET